MKERLPGLVAILLLILLVLGTWWASDFALRSIQVDPPRRLTHERDSWSGKFTMVSTDAQGLATNRLEGTAMAHFPDTDSYDITQPRAVGHQPDSPVTVGTALTGTLDQHGERIVLKGDAHLRRLPDAEHKLLDVRSQQLTIEPNRDLVYTDLPALVINGNSTMRGQGMRYDNRTRQLTVKAASDVKISGEDQANRNTESKKTTQP
ncbi:LPS export ABC transporter periplasmic protein LptC [Castellaniella caeni]|uniref:LPS export ABC transporter periplasmic protein LptC n=1 Tax=Castellaniella caeni TaxID=266123 RepID=UPI00082AF966|nr:LPS export ABC transporter periplasmic protein LptC [Castellaniella caeni]